MKDNRLYNMKHRAERDKRLSHPAHRLLAVLISAIYNSPHDMADDEFPLPWSRVRDWIRLEEDQCYHYVRQLQLTEYITPTGLRGCPPTNFFKFKFAAVDYRGSNSRENPGIDSRRNAGINSVKKAGINSGKKPGDHISSSLREELLAKEAGKRVATAPGKKVVRASPEGDELKRRQGESVADFQRRCKTHHGLN